MVGTRSEAHAARIGKALRDKFRREQDQALLQRMLDMYASGMSCEQVGKAVGKPMVTVNRWLRNAGQRIRGACEQRKGGTWSEARRAATPERAKPAPVYVDGQPIKGQQLLSHRAIGNKTLSPHGYVVVRLGRRVRRYEHTLVAERVLGRPLRKGEVVHHINCIRTDNRPENLLVCTHKYHLQLHARMRRDSYWQEVARQAKAQTVASK